MYCRSESSYIPTMASDSAPGYELRLQGAVESDADTALGDTEASAAVPLTSAVCRLHQAVVEDTEAAVEDTSAAAELKCVICMDSIYDAAVGTHFYGAATFPMQTALQI